MVCLTALAPESGPEYKAMDINSQFDWMKANQNRRLVLGRSGIEGYGIFARQPIYKVSLKSFNMGVDLSTQGRDGGGVHRRGDQASGSGCA